MELKEYKNKDGDHYTEYTYYETIQNRCTLHGLYKCWFRGKLQAEENYVHDIRHGTQTYWVELKEVIEYWWNGNKCSKYEYEEKLIIEKVW